MTHITTSTSSSAWTREGEDPPTSSSPTGDVADFLEGIVIPEMTYSGNCSSYPGHENPPSRAVIRAYCENAGYPWSSVAKELRGRRYSHLGRDASPLDTLTPAGIAVRTKVVEDTLYGLAPMCPVMRRGMGKKSFRPATWKEDCGSWGCPRCGVILADELYRHIDMIIEGVSQVFVAVAPYRTTQASMMGHRRRDAKAEMFWYRDVTGNVTYLSDKPLPGRKPPSSWMAMSPSEALRSLQTTLWVPGHREHRWSEGWAPPPPQRKVSDEGWFNIMDLSDAQVLRAQAIFAEEAERDYGVKVATGHIPAQHQAALTEMMGDILDQVRGEVDGEE
jgi:hypothetical protein